MSFQPPIITETNTPVTNGQVEVVKTPEPCADCGPEVFDLNNFKEWSDHDLLAAILVEMIMIRRTFTDMSAGFEAVSSGPMAKILGGLFGGS